MIRYHLGMKNHSILVALIVTFLFLLSMLFITTCVSGCSDKASSEVRTDGFMAVEDGWLEVERRAVGDTVYVKMKHGHEIRWVEIKALRSRVMAKDEVVPQ